MISHVLLTGASGFVGGWLAEFLARKGHQVTALVRNPIAATSLKKLDIQCIEGDLRNTAMIERAVERSEVVYHVAGLVRALSSEQLFEVNEAGVRNLLSACEKRTTPPKVVIVSSLAAAGPSSNDSWKVESDEPKPVSYYGKSKLAGERVARTFAGRLNLSIVRPPIVFGGRDTAFAEMIRPIVQLGLHPYPGALPFRRYSVVHVTDLCRAIWLVGERGESLASSESDAARGKGIYFVADAARYGYVDLGRMIAQASGNRFWIPTPLFDSICWAGGAINEIAGRFRGKPMLVNFDKVRESSAGSWTCSPEKILRQLAWSPQKSVADRMQETVDWYFSEGWFKPPTGYQKHRAFKRAQVAPAAESSRRAS